MGSTLRIVCQWPGFNLLPDYAQRAESKIGPPALQPGKFDGTNSRAVPRVGEGLARKNASQGKPMSRLAVIQLPGVDFNARDCLASMAVRFGRIPNNVRAIAQSTVWRGRKRRWI
jgi:hypothetical protein